MVFMVQGSCSTPCKLDGILKHIRHYFSLHHISIAHVYRETNKLVDSLANLDCSHSTSLGFFSLADLPKQAKDLIILD